MAEANDADDDDGSDGSDEASEETTGVTLGFLDDPEDAAELCSAAFPSKAGGKPAWLDLERLPAKEAVACGACGVQMVLLLQVHAPLSRVRASAVLRSVFVFVCRGCNTYRALRCQLPDTNPFYPPDSARTATPALLSGARVAPVCDVCGCAGPLVCSRCHVARYCGQHHQRLAWNSGHSRLCAPNADPAALHSVPRDPGLLFPEHIIVHDDEPLRDPPLSADPRTEAHVQQLLAQHNAATASSSLHTEGEEEEEEDEERGVMSAVKAAEAATVEDPEFHAFSQRMRRAPEQVLRYLHNVGAAEDGDPLLEPLWCASEGRPTAVPACELCGAPRVAEFQIMPQLLYLLHVPADSNLDFGTIVVYACSASCDPPASYPSAYIPEFVWVQHPRSTHAPPVVPSTAAKQKEATES